MSSDKTILLRTRDLSVGYEYFLFEKLNLELKGGELVCFMGSNGAGKSTLIRTLAGLQQPVQGTIEGANTNRIDVKDIAVVLTEKITSVNMTVRELITFGRYPYLDWTVRLRDYDRKVIDESIDKVHVRHLLDKKLFELSDGQLQMVMIARALAQETAVILLDEPTAHLDLNNRVDVMRLLRTLARETNRAILVATHELDLALQTTDLIWLAGKNRNIITGIPEDLVLNGTFDSIFEFKGFDLKTGKVQHEAHRRRMVQLVGDGHQFLWTKNALERSGYEVTSSAGAHVVSIQTKSASTIWAIDGKPMLSISELLEYLHNNVSPKIN
jgi:iron complex transport system ATP-binding protein